MLGHFPLFWTWTSLSFISCSLSPRQEWDHPHTSPCPPLHRPHPHLAPVKPSSFLWVLRVSKSSKRDDHPWCCCSQQPRSLPGHSIAANRPGLPLWVPLFSSLCYFHHFQQYLPSSLNYYSFGLELRMNYQSLVSPSLGYRYSLVSLLTTHYYYCL